MAPPASDAGGSSSPGGRAWICCKNGNIPYVRHKLAGEEPPLRNLAPRRAVVARGAPGRKAAWGAKSPWKGAGAGVRLSPPQPDSPASSGHFPKTPMEPAPGLLHLPGAAGIVVMEMGVLAWRGGGHPSRQGVLPTPPAPEAWRPQSSPASQRGQSSAMASRAQGGLEAGQVVHEPGDSEEIHTSQAHGTWACAPGRGQAGPGRPGAPTW